MRSKSFALDTLFVFLRLLREVCHSDDASRAGADAGGEQKSEVILLTRSAVIPVPISALIIWCLHVSGTVIFLTSKKMLLLAFPQTGFVLVPFGTNHNLPQDHMAG